MQHLLLLLGNMKIGKKKFKKIVTKSHFSTLINRTTERRGNDAVHG